MKTSLRLALFFHAGEAMATWLFLCATACHAQEVISGQSGSVLNNGSFTQEVPGQTKGVTLGGHQREFGQVTQADAGMAPDGPAITPENQAIASALADGLTTHLALSAGAVESNPILPTSPLALITMAGVKVGMVKYANTLPEPDKRMALKSFSSFWGGAAANNVMVLLAVPMPFPIIAGAMMGLVTWMNLATRYEKADQLAVRNKKIADALTQTDAKPAPIDVTLRN